MDVDLLFTQGIAEADIYLDGVDLQVGNNLATAVTMSIFTDRRANDDDLLTRTEDKRGWWGDTFSPNADDKIGSRLWLLRRSKQTAQTLALARQYVLESLQWLIADRIAKDLEVLTEVTSPGILGIQVTITRPDGSTVIQQYTYVWDEF